MADGVKVSRRTARKIGGALRWVDAQRRDATNASGDRGGFAPWVILQGDVTTAIPTGTRTSPSTSGMADLYAWSGTAFELVGNFRVVNGMALASSVAVGKRIKAYWQGNDFHLLAAECP